MEKWHAETLQKGDALTLTLERGTPVAAARDVTELKATGTDVAVVIAEVRENSLVITPTEPLEIPLSAIKSVGDLVRVAVRAPSEASLSPTEVMMRAELAE